MSLYPSSDRENRIDYTVLLKTVRSIFEKCGMSTKDASLLAQTLVNADLRGCHSHGVIRVPEYVEKLTVKGLNPKGEPKVVSEKQAAIEVDGDNAMGQIACLFAMEKAIERAKESSPGYGMYTRK